MAEGIGLVHLVDPIFENGRLAFTDVRSEVPPTYPSKFWSTNPGKIPLNIKTRELKVSYYEVKSMLQNNRWDDITVATFMINVMKSYGEKFEVKLTVKWEADGRTIGEADQIITPVDLFDISELENPEGYVEEKGIDGGNDTERISMFLALVSLYRKITTQSIEVEYGTKIKEKLDIYLKANEFGLKDGEITMVNNKITQDKMTPSYRKIIASIDMFFYKFTDLPWSGIRLATLPSRYKGCVILTSLSQIARGLGVSISDMAKFIFTLPIAKDAHAVAKRDEGERDVNGYFAYQMDFGITNKSCYSMGSNPTLFLFLHCIGCYLGMTRSMNARMSDAIDLMGTFNNAVIAAINISGYSDVNYQIVDTEAEVLAIRERMNKYKTLKEASDLKDRDEDLEEGEEDESEEGFEPEEDDQVTLARAKAENMTPLNIKVQTALVSLLQNNGLSRSNQEIAKRKARKCQKSLNGTIGEFFYSTCKEL